MPFSFNGVTPTTINFNGSPVYTLIYNGVTVWTAAVKVTYYVDSGTTYQESVVSGNSVLSPTSFTPSKSGYTFVGWRENNTASSSVLSSKTMGTSPITLYAVFKRTITLSYNGNGSTSGSVSSQTGTQYYNNGNYSNVTFTLASNGFTKTGYTFSKWAIGSASGTQYSAGSSVSLNGSTTFYAVWTAQTGVLYQNGSLTTLGNALVSSLTASKTLKPAAYAGFIGNLDAGESVTYNAITCNTSLSLKITWSVYVSYYPNQSDQFDAKINNTSIYSFCTGSTAENPTYPTTKTTTGTTTVSNVTSIPVYLFATNNNSIVYNYLTFTITKIEAV